MKSQKKDTIISDAFLLAFIILISVLGFFIIGLITFILAFGAAFFGIALSISTIVILFSILCVAALILIPGFFGGNETATGAQQVIITLVIINAIHFGILYFQLTTTITTLILLSILIILLVPIFKMLIHSLVDHLQTN